MSGRYDIFRGIASPAAIDWVSPVASVPAGTGQAVLAGLGHEIGVDYWYGIRAVSDAGISEANTDRICRVQVDDLGLAGPRPARPASAEIIAAAGGRMRLRAVYMGIGAETKAVSLQVAEVSGGAINWNQLIATIPISPQIARVDRLLDETWPDGQLVRLAIRAVTSAGRAGPHRLTNRCGADTSAPATVEWIEVM